MKVIKETENFKLVVVEKIDGGLEILKKATDKFNNVYYKPLFKVGTENEQDKDFLKLFEEILK